MGQEVSLSHLLTVMGLSGPKPLLVIVVCGAVALASSQCRRDGLAVAKRGPYLIYAITSCLVCLATIGKIGSSTNYLIEPWLALLLWIVFALRDVQEISIERPILRSRNCARDRVFVAR